MNIIEIKQYDVVNGIGIRTSIWLAGCNNHCKKCWSPNTWNPNQGNPYKDVKNEILGYLQDGKTDGVSILGGDPLYSVFEEDNYDDLLDLLKTCKRYNKQVWLWTGYKFEDIVKKCPVILGYIDCLIDGKFDVNQRDLNLFYRGSSNQRIIFFNKPLNAKDFKFKYYVATYVNDVSIGGTHYLMTEYNKYSKV